MPEKGELDANHEALLAALDGLSTQAVDAVVTPECFLDGYLSTEEGIDAATLRSYAVDPDGSPYVRSVAAWARDHSCWVVLGCTRASVAGVHNTALVLNRAGELAGIYDKTHLQAHDRKYVPGQGLPTFASDFGPFGIVICADRRWPESIRSLALKGARVIFNPTYGMHCDLNRAMMQTRSYESEVFIAFTHPQQSLLTAPDGRVITDERRTDEMSTVSEIDLSEADAARATEAAHLRDRRPELYAT